jgi:hypothetical protein
LSCTGGTKPEVKFMKFTMSRVLEIFLARTEPTEPGRAMLDDSGAKGSIVANITRTK